MKDNTFVDADRQTMWCEVCGDEVPIPLGALDWAAAVMKAFADAHAGGPHEGGKTRFSTPAGPVAGERATDGHAHTK